MRSFVRPYLVCCCSLCIIIIYLKFIAYLCNSKFKCNAHETKEKRRRNRFMNKNSIGMKKKNKTACNQIANIYRQLNEMMQRSLRLFFPEYFISKLILRKLLLFFFSIIKILFISKHTHTQNENANETK